MTQLLTEDGSAILTEDGSPILLEATVAGTIEDVVYAVLSGDATLVALVADRISPDIRPQAKTGPGLRFEVETEDGLQGLDGLTGDYFAHVSIEAVAKNRATCRQLANRLRKLMPSIEGTSVLGTRIQRVNFDSEESDFTPVNNGTDRPDRSMTSVFVIQYWTP